MKKSKVLLNITNRKLGWFCQIVWKKVGKIVRIDHGNGNVLFIFTVIIRSVFAIITKLILQFKRYSQLDCKCRRNFITARK